MPTMIAQSIKDNVLCRCGQAVTRLAEAGLIQWPDMPSGEMEVNQWWLVTDTLAARLLAAKQPVIRFGELNMWGRSSTSADLKDDPDLAGAILG